MGQITTIGGGNGHNYYSIEFPYNINPNAIIEFDYLSDVEAEIYEKETSAQ
ncbi:hypothetical protein HCH_00099 [Hahella chejuensis KCTC 2396]|uniref:Uncharacterized protein n=1 Tax=Hahella chejuensis (strain KCTC 2396) TaxID=349521 RepID=Q2SQQ4_HAHCH|nr:hypothetical protein HCH_00099 [Hahella chejuensis KCTC 2396]